LKNKNEYSENKILLHSWNLENSCTLHVQLLLVLETHRLCLQYFLNIFRLPVLNFENTTFRKFLKNSCTIHVLLLIILETNRLCLQTFLTSLGCLSSISKLITFRKFLKKSCTVRILLLLFLVHYAWVEVSEAHGLAQRNNLWYTGPTPRSTEDHLLMLCPLLCSFCFACCHCLLLLVHRAQVGVSGAHGLVPRNAFSGARDQARAPPKTTHLCCSALLLLFAIALLLLLINCFTAHFGAVQYLLSLSFILATPFWRSPISCSR